MQHTNGSPAILVTAWIIWAGFLLTLVVYLIICEILGIQTGAEANAELPLIWIRTGAYALAIILFPIITGLKYLILKPRSETQTPTQTPPRSPDSSRYLAAVVLALALADSIGTLGFLLFLMDDDYRTLYMFMGMSVICMLIHRPRQAEIEKTRQ